MPKTNAEYCRDYRKKKRKNKIKKTPKSSTERVRKFRERRKALVNVENDSSIKNNDNFNVQNSESDHNYIPMDIGNVQGDDLIENNIVNNECVVQVNQQPATPYSQFRKFFINIFGYTCSVCEQLLFQEDLKPSCAEHEDLLRVIIENYDTNPNSMELMLKRTLISKGKLATITKDEGVTQFTCMECSAQYDEKEKLELHLYSHYHTYRYLCGVCGTGLKRKEHLDRHMQEHTEYRPHVCPECGKGFKRKEHLNIHSSIHKGEKSLPCSICEKTFYRKDHLQKHLQTHNKYILQYMEQNKIFVNEPEFDIKEEVDDDFDDIQPIITSVTGGVEGEITMEEEERDESALDQSVDYSRDPELYDSSRPHVCPECGKSYKRKDHLKIHSWTHKRKEVLCGQCGKAFHTMDQMMVHVNLVHIRAHEASGEGISQLRAMLGDQIDIEVVNHPPSPLSFVMPKRKSDDSRPHQCPICHRKFKRKQHLKVHANVHLRQPQAIWCSMCNEGFSTNEQYEIHVCQWSNHDTTDNGDGGDFEPASASPPPEAKKENNPIEFVEVVVKEEAEVPAESEAHLPTPAKVFVCKFCSKPFKRKDHYKIHLHVHTGIKSCFCPDCGKGFYRKDHLQKHMIVHAKFRTRPRPKKEIPDLFPINMLPKKEIKPEITIRAPSNAVLRVPLQIKVPYQVVMSLDNGERRAVTIDPQHPAPSAHEASSRPSN